MSSKHAFVAAFLLLFAAGASVQAAPVVESGTTVCAHPVLDPLTGLPLDVCQSVPSLFTHVPDDTPCVVVQGGSDPQVYVVDPCYDAALLP